MMGDLGAAADSRYAKIMQVMRSAEQNRPRMRRLGDTLGAFYTPMAVLIALAAWGISARGAVAIGARGISARYAVALGTGLSLQNI